MKLLLDENLPHALRHEISGHDVFTAAFMGWSGVENGALLKLAAGANFDAFITNDRGLMFEQNQASLPVSVVVLLAKINTIEGIRPLLLRLRESLVTLQPSTLITVTA